MHNRPIPLSKAQELTTALGGKLELNSLRSRGIMTFQISTDLRLEIEFTTLVSVNGHYYSLNTHRDVTHITFPESASGRTPYHFYGKGSRNPANWQFAQDILEDLCND